LGPSLPGSLRAGKHVTCRSYGPLVSAAALFYKRAGPTGLRRSFSSPRVDGMDRMDETDKAFT
jgi:hypothetical protein